MFSKLNEHISDLLTDYELDKKSGHFVYTRAEKDLMKEFDELKDSLLNTFDQQQKELFEKFFCCMQKKEYSPKNEYFTQGFSFGILGLNMRSELFKID